MAIAVLLTAGGCSDSGASAPPTSSVPPGGAPGAVTSTLVARGSAPPPESTGVPGLDSPDVFCASWARYAGTLQALGVAASFGDLSSARFAALELVAAPLLAEIGAQIETGWPTELIAEREAVVDQRMGPYVRRAQHGRKALVDAGVTPQQLSELGAIWQASLAQRDPQVPVIEVRGIGADLQAKVDAAAHAFDSAVTPFSEDPSLRVQDVEAPQTDAYLASRCPDLASSGVGDAL